MAPPSFCLYPTCAWVASSCSPGLGTLVRSCTFGKDQPLVVSSPNHASMVPVESLPMASTNSA